MYSSTLSLTSAIDGVDGQLHAPAALPPGKTRYQMYRRLGGPQCWAGGGAENIVFTGIRSTDRPARSESLNLLSYLGPLLIRCSAACSIYRSTDVYNKIQYTTNIFHDQYQHYMFLHRSASFRKSTNTNPQVQHFAPGLVKFGVR